MKVLTKCQAQSTSDFDNIALAYKAAELQGRLRAERFIHLMQNEIIPKRDIITEDMICDCINMQVLIIKYLRKIYRRASLLIA